MIKLELADDHKRRGVSTIAILLILAALNGCVAGTPIDAAISARPSTVLQLSWAKAKRTDQGIIVWGQVQQVHCCRYLRGYIHIEARDQHGGSLAATNTHWGEFNPRQLHSAWFKAVLPVSGQNMVSVIDIQFSAAIP